MKCHYTYDEEGNKILIPGCTGTANKGIEHCTCRPEKIIKFEREQYNEAIRELQTEKKELERENARLNRIIKKLLKHK